MKKIRGIICLLFISIFFLQGCSYFEGTTSIKVEISESGQRVEAELKANKAEDYNWKYFTKLGKITESASDFNNNIFNDTETQKYAFVINERESDTLQFVLFKTGELDTAKVYSYDMSYDDDGNIVLGEMLESKLVHNEELMEKVKAAQ